MSRRLQQVLRTILFVLLVNSSVLTSKAWAENENIEDRPYWLFLGLEGGLNWKRGTSLPEVNADGWQLGLKVILTRYTTNWVFDLGLGWRYDKLSVSNLDIKTKTFLLKAGIDYRLSRRIHAGPVAHLLVGEDTSFSDTGTNSDDAPVNLLLGLKGLYDIPTQSDWMLRTGLQVMTDVTIADRRIYQAQILFEAGFPISQKADAPHTKPAVASNLESNPKFRVNLSNAGVQFASASDRLTENSQILISNLGKILAKHQGSWNQVIVEGHTDAAGSYALNMSLSQKRAEAVKRTLVSAGLSEQKITASGYGPDQPLDPAATKAAYQLNRRVEMKLQGVQEEDVEFVNSFNDLLKLHKR